MHMDHIEQATFSAVYRFLQGKEDSAIKNCFCNLFKISLLLFPAILGPEEIMLTQLASGASLAGIGVGKLVRDAAQDAFACFRNKSASDYYSRFDQMQIAQVMLVYASYFDAISQFLPNENDEIQITSDLKRTISREALEQYCKDLEQSAQNPRPDVYLMNEEIALPDPNEGFASYERKLLHFFGALNEQFVRFFERCPFWESLDGENDPLDQEQKQFFRDCLAKLPQQAIAIYRKQYFALSKTFPDFAIWANLENHQRLERHIDVGFSQVMDLINRLYAFPESKACKASSTLWRYKIKYDAYIQEPVIERSDSDTSFPARKDIFIPQAFQALTYRSGMALAQKSLWANAPGREEIGAHIRSALSHPSYGHQPLLILGHPGAGKTLLCHMLAAQILSAEYHVIMIRLRDAAAEDPIHQQIDAQIMRDFGDGTCWNDIREAELDKPVLLIFDGYDELLQASGKTYANYLLDIAKFQEEQLRYFRMFVRCIVTSRITLIDKAAIPAGSQVLHLCDFDSDRIQVWADIWNQYHEALFAERGLEELKIASSGRIRELAGQPLLLLMLALYVMNGNSLGTQTELSRSELYYKLINDFIARESKKDAKFLRLSESKQLQMNAGSFRRLGVAALGMHNRRKLAIRSVELKQDLAFLSPSGTLQKSDIADTYALEEDEKLVGSFFFVHNSETTVRSGRTEVRLSAYEFLHNTFGEFLTAYYILDTAFRLVRRQRSDEALGEPFTWASAQEKEWHSGLAYTPLFTRPVVLNMIHELLPIMEAEKDLTDDEVRTALDSLFSGEIRRLISGELYGALEKTLSAQDNPFAHPELPVHAAVYSVNLILLRAAVGCFDFTECLGSATDWHKLAQLWRYAFSEEDLAGLSCILWLEKRSGIHFLTYHYDENATKRAEAMSKLDRMYHIAGILGEDAAMAVFGVCNGRIDSCLLSVLEQEKLPLKVQYMLNRLFRYTTGFDSMAPQDLVTEMDSLLRYGDEKCSYWGIYIYCFLTAAFAKQDRLDKTSVFQLLNQPFTDVLVRSMREVNSQNQNVYMYTVFQCILDSLECVPFQLDKYLNLIHCIMNKTEYLPQRRRGQTLALQRQLKQLFSLYCQNMLKALDNGKAQSIQRACDALREICVLCAPHISWYGIPQLLEVCEKIHKSGDGDTEHHLLSAYLQHGGCFPDMGYLRRLHRKSEYIRCIIKYYHYMWRTCTYYNSDPLFMELLEEIDTLGIFLPLDEEAVFQLLCLLCAFPDAVSSLRFDLAADLERLLHRHGSVLSVQTVQKILECARQFGYTVVCDAVQQMFFPAS